MERRMKGRTLPFAVFFLFLSLFAFGEKKSYTEVITTDPLVEKGLSVSAGKRIGVWRPPTEKKELPTDRKITLEDLVQHALTYNAELGQMRSEVNQAKIGVMGAKANYFPKVDFQASMTWFLNPLKEIGLKQGELGIVEIPNVGSVMLPMEDYSLYDARDNSFYRFVFTLEQPIFTWGKIPAAVKLYREAARAAELKCARKERELEASVNGYYFSLYYLNQISAALGEQMQYSDRLLLLTRSSYENGFITLTDFQDVQTKVKDVQIADSRVKDSFNMIRYKLIAALGGTNVDLENIDFTGAQERLAEFETADWMKTLDEYVSQAKAASVEMDLLRAQVEVYVSVFGTRLVYKRFADFKRFDRNSVAYFGRRGPSFDDYARRTGAAKREVSASVRGIYNRIDGFDFVLEYRIQLHQHCVSERSGGQLSASG